MDTQVDTTAASSGLQAHGDAPGPTWGRVSGTYPAYTGLHKPERHEGPDQVNWGKVGIWPIRCGLATRLMLREMR